MSEAAAQERPRRRARLGILAVAALAALYLAGTFAAPILIADDREIGRWLSWSYSPVCHQQPERSLEVAGGHQAVCARCSGLYIGGVAGLIAATLLVVGRRRVPVWAFVVLCAPTFVDALLPWLGLPQLDRVGRLLLAVPAGAIAGTFMALGLWEIFLSAQRPALSDAESLRSKSISI